jgi:hypothetical protein
MIGAVSRWLEALSLADKEEMVREYIGETGGTSDLARLDDDDLKDLMIVSIPQEHSIQISLTDGGVQWCF